MNGYGNVDDRDNETVQKLRRQLRDIRRTVTYEEHGSFITIRRQEFIQLTNKACVDTIHCHGELVDVQWMRSFRKRFWGSLKNLHNNRQQAGENDE